MRYSEFKTSKAPQACQIQRHAPQSPRTAQRHASTLRGDFVHGLHVAETETQTHVLSPQELQVKALADKAEDYKQQEKALKARQQMAKAQQQLTKAQKPLGAS